MVFAPGAQPGRGVRSLDSTGLSIVGAGEWAAEKYGGRGRRGWRKLHLGVDQSGVIRVHTLTEATGDDATTALDLLNAVEGPLVRVTADAASDTVAVYERRNRSEARRPSFLSRSSGHRQSGTGIGAIARTGDRSVACWRVRRAVLHAHAEPPGGGDSHPAAVQPELVVRRLPAAAGIRASCRMGSVGNGGTGEGGPRTGAREWAATRPA